MCGLRMIKEEQVNNALPLRLQFKTWDNAHVKERVTDFLRGIDGWRACLGFSN